jgi:hypothetical protein
MDIIETCTFSQSVGTGEQYFPANCSKIRSRIFDVALCEYREGRTEDDSTGRHDFRKEQALFRFEYCFCSKYVVFFDVLNL